MNEEKLTNLLTYLAEQQISVEPCIPKISVADFTDHKTDQWSPFAVFYDKPIKLNDGMIAVSAASMAAVHILDARPNMDILDTCAAPGIKGLYLNKLIRNISYTANDLSYARLSRMKRLFHQFSVDAEIIHSDARVLSTKLQRQSFDRIIVDAPCSGEGVILGGDHKLLDAWSTAKVKRLQQLQVKILKSAWQILKPGGRLVYATCTLNKNENERVIQKALKIQLNVQTSPLMLTELPALSNGEAWRILPSKNSIGFFIAVLEKNEEIA